MGRRMMRYGGWRAALMGALLTFGWLLLFMLSILSPILPALTLPTGVFKGFGSDGARGGETANLRKVLEAATVTTHKVGALSIEPRTNNRDAASANRLLEM